MKKLIIGAMLMIFPFSLFGCGTEKELVPTTQEISAGDVSAIEISPSSNIAEGEELMCLVETEAEAKEIAKQYGITLVKCEYGVATFHTEESLTDVIERGKKEGYKELSINYTMSLY